MKLHIPITLLTVAFLLGISSFAGVHIGVIGLDKERVVLPERVLSANNDNFDMVIVAPEVFSDALQPLIDHKNNVGVVTFLKTTETIYDEFSGRDQAEQIKYFIKDAIEQFDVTYVLLIGGRRGQSFDWHVPARYSHVEDGIMHTKFLSDLYFADIYKENGAFEDWDSNGNGVFSEWSEGSLDPVDIMDLKPDVYVGRLPCRNQREVSMIVDKIIAYETNVFGQLWLHNIVLVGGDTIPGVGEPFPNEGETDTEWVLNYLDGFNATKLFLSDGTLEGSDDIVNAINRGCGFVYYGGHGGGLIDGRRICQMILNGRVCLIIGMYFSSPITKCILWSWLDAV